MAFQFSTGARNASLDAIETAIGTSAILRIRSGTVPANCGTADSGTVLATMNLPTDWMAAASGGSKGLSGTWQDASAAAAGTLPLAGSSAGVVAVAGAVSGALPLAGAGSGAVSITGAVSGALALSGRC